MGLPFCLKRGAMVTIKKMVENIMEECIQDKPSWMAIRSWCMEILRLIDHYEHKK